MDMKLTRKEKRIWRRLVLMAMGLIVICMLAGLMLGILYLTDSRTSDDPTPPGDGENTQGPDTPSNGHPDEGDQPGEPVDDPTGTRMLAQTADRGMAYIDRMVFVGESTTAHLRSRGVLSGGTGTDQVWSNKDNTMTLDLNILQKTIRYPQTGENLTIPQAAEKRKPDILVISFGLNGVMEFERRPDLYEQAYGKLIQAIHEMSPETVVILQTVYPVAENQSAFRADAKTINGYLAKLNAALPGIAAKYDAWVVDTASVLLNEEGLLRADYQTDGIHLTTQAYEEILRYLRTHALEK